MKKKDDSLETRRKNERILTIHFDGQDNDEPGESVEERRRSRKERQNKIRRHRYLCALCILFVIWLIYLNWDVLSPRAIGANIGDLFSGFEKSRYPVVLSEGNFVGAVPVGRDLGVLTDTSFLIYSPSGKLLVERSHGMSSPSVVSSGSKAVVFDRGGKTFRVETRFAETYSGQTDYPIITAAASESGSFAVVTESESYLGEIKVFNPEGNNIFRYFSADGRVLCAALSPDGKRLAAVMIGAKNGDIESTVKIYNTDNTKPISEKKLSRPDAVLGRIQKQQPDYRRRRSRSRIYGQ